MIVEEREREMEEGYEVTIRWGSESAQEETYESPTDGNVYSFKSEAELEAFLLGVDEASGWLDYTIVEPEEAK